MRWLQASESDIRRRAGFLFFPKTIGGETRWMEWAAWEEKNYNRPDYFGWKPLSWVAA